MRINHARIPKTVPEAVLKDFRNHVFFCFKYLNLGKPTPKQYAMADRICKGFFAGEPIGFILQAGRTDGKSTILAIFVSWVLLLNPDSTNMVLSATAPKAKQFVSMVRMCIELVPYMKHLKPKKDSSPDSKDNADGFNVGARKRYGQDWSIIARGIEGQITGLHADNIFIDDIEIAGTAEGPNAQEILYNKFLETVNVSNRQPDSIEVILGTPHSSNTVYTRMAEHYPIVKFPAVMPNLDDPDEVEHVDPYILGLKLEPGRSTQPERFSEESLAKAAAKLGPALFSLHYKLMTKEADEKKFPLHLRDLIVFDPDLEGFPATVQWGTYNAVKELVCFGLKGDGLYAPTAVSDQMLKYTDMKMVIDPSGRGKDDTAYIIMGLAGNKIVVFKWGAVPDVKGYGDRTFEKIMELIDEYGVRRVECEDDFGDGMFTTMLAGRLLSAGITGVEVTGFKAPRTQKETRICDTLEPLVATHRIVVSKDAIKDKENQVQFTRIRRRRGALKHDDRIDVLYQGCVKWVENMHMDDTAAQEAAELAALEEGVLAWERGTYFRNHLEKATGEQALISIKDRFDNSSKRARERFARMNPARPSITFIKPQKGLIR